MVFKNKINLKSEGIFNFIDITEKIKEMVDNSNVKNGVINIQSFHTTFSIIVNEKENLLLSDIKNILEKIAPEDGIYNHDNYELRGVSEIKPNGHAHCKAVILGVSVCLNIIDGKLNLGPWQRIFAVELDRARNRQVSVVIVGE